jgi:ADP-ribose pyrophosphatase YjhB (NUDIX family)
MSKFQAPCNYRVSVKALIQDKEGRILLFKEQNGWWEIPGGGWEHDELIVNALQREIKEESGLSLAWVDEKPSFVFQAKNPQGEPIINIIIKATLTSHNFTPSSECEEMTYFSPSEMLLLEAFDNVHVFADLLIKTQNHTS